MKLIVDHSRVYLEGVHPKHIIDPVTSYKTAGYFFSPAFKRGQWDGRKRFVEYDRKRAQYFFPTGFLNSVIEALEKAEYRYTLEDSRDFEPKEADYNLLPDLEINQGKYDFQGAALDTALMHGRGIIKISTGGGKTSVGAAIIKSIGEQTTWFTHRSNLLHQSRDALEKRLGCEVGVVGDNESIIKPVTVCMIQTAFNRLKEEDHEVSKHILGSKLLILDEVQHLISNQWYSVLAKLNSPWRFGLSATPNLVGEGLALLAQTGNIIFEISAQALIDRGVLVPPRIWFYDVASEKVTEKMNYPQVYNKLIVNNSARNQAILAISQSLKREGKSNLILVKRINHGELLADQLSAAGVKAEFMCGKNSTEERAEMLKRLFDGSLHALVAMTEIMGEGVDLPDLRAVINATGSSGGGDAAKEDESGRVTIQMLGRVLRSAPGKQYAEYFDFSDQSHKFLKSATKDRVSTLDEHGFSGYIKNWNERQEEG